MSACSDVTVEYALYVLDDRGTWQYVQSGMVGCGEGSLHVADKVIRETEKARDMVIGVGPPNEGGFS